MLGQCLSRRLVNCNKRTNSGVQLLHQYHIHAIIRGPTVAPTFTLDNNPTTKTTDPSSRLKQLTRHLSTTQFPSLFSNMSGYRTRKVGQPFTLEHRVYIEDNHGNVVSPFHDIPLYANEQQTVLNMVVEIPRWTNAKMEVRRVNWFIPLAPSMRLIGLWHTTDL